MFLITMVNSRKSLVLPKKGGSDARLHFANPRKRIFFQWGGGQPLVGIEEFGVGKVLR